ncbi:MAG: GGDEF domain-containing protein [Treponema sp.]|nr:GGDEF domain-containing protein [Treponema sp.]
MFFYITDFTWIILPSLKIKTAAFVETYVYFIVMAVSVLLWTQYVIVYLARKNKFAYILKYTGWIVFILKVSIVVINFFVPIAFWFDDDCNYYTGFARSLNFMLQVGMFIATALYTLIVTCITKEKTRYRHRTICGFSTVMSFFIVVQVFFPLMPFYSVGFLLGTCLLHTFLLEHEKEEKREELEKLIQIKNIQEVELGSTRQRAYTDPLTGVKNKAAYMEDIDAINRRIEDGLLKDFAAAVFDVNGLKIINDTLGHEEGDRYIQAACSLISSHFKHSPVYRIGGDEFVAFLSGEDFTKRKPLIKSFNRKVQKNLLEGKVVVSCGSADFNPTQDSNYTSVFSRADKQMYEQKCFLKENAGKR